MVAAGGHRKREDLVEYGTAGWSQRGIAWQNWFAFACLNAGVGAIGLHIPRSITAWLRQNGKHRARLTALMTVKDADTRQMRGETSEGFIQRPSIQIWLELWFRAS